MTIYHLHSKKAGNLSHNLNNMAHLIFNIIKSNLFVVAVVVMEAVFVVSPPTYFESP
jgi:hypothetical protein